MQGCGQLMMKLQSGFAVLAGFWFSTLCMLRFFSVSWFNSSFLGFTYTSFYRPFWTHSHMESTLPNRKHTSHIETCHGPVPCWNQPHSAKMPGFFCKKRLIIIFVKSLLLVIGSFVKLPAPFSVSSGISLWPLW